MNEYDQFRAPLSRKTDPYFTIDYLLKASLCNLEFKARKKNCLQKFTKTWNPFKEFFNEN